MKIRIKGGYLDFSHPSDRIEKNIYIAKIYMKQEDHDGPISVT